MDNAAYCAWITNPVNWGGGIELAILASHYSREIAAWNIETGQCHVFGEERGFSKQVMVIYNGVHYDVLVIASNPRAPLDGDVTEFNPRTKKGKMIIAAARTLVELNNKGAHYVSPSKSKPLKCSDCSTQLSNHQAAQEHATATGHVNFEEVAA
eukprot:jgi/Chrzof1/1282/Cz10g01040.t1